MNFNFTAPSSGNRRWNRNKTNFSCSSQRASELGIDNYNGGKCGSMNEEIFGKYGSIKEGILGQQPQKRCNLRIRRCKGFFDLEGETFSIEVCIAGILREPWDFVAQDVNVGHPRSMFVYLNSEVIEMLRINFALDPRLVVKEKAQFASFGHYVARNSTVKRKPWASVFFCFPKKCSRHRDTQTKFWWATTPMGSPFRMATTVACLSSWFEATFTKHRVGTQNGKGHHSRHFQTGVFKNPDPDLDEEEWEQTPDELSNRWTWLVKNVSLRNT